MVFQSCHSAGATMKTVEKATSSRRWGFPLCHFVISEEMRKLKRLFPSWSTLLWSSWQPSCRLGCKHFRVVVHGLLQGAARFAVLLPSIVCWTNVQTLFSRWVEPTFTDLGQPGPWSAGGVSALAACAVASFLLNRIPYDNTANLSSKSNVGSGLWAR